MFSFCPLHEETSVFNPLYKTHSNCSISSNHHHNLFCWIIIYFNRSLTYIIKRSKWNRSIQINKPLSKNKEKKTFTRYFLMFSYNHYKHVEQLHNLLMEVVYVFVNIHHKQLDHIYDNDAIERKNKSVYITKKNH
jgi:hypothetical protein